MNERIATKKREAEGIMRECLGTHGVWADPTRYRYQCWTRDFALASQPCLLADKRNHPLLAKHLRMLGDLQAENGQIPILYLDGLRGHVQFLAAKIGKSLQHGKVGFMLKRYLRGKLHQLTPGTRDSEILYLLALLEYVAATGDSDLRDDYAVNIDLALGYIENYLMLNGLVLGCDWRDTMDKQLGDMPLLTNNCLLYRVYCLMGRKEKAAAFKARIRASYFQKDRIIDYPGAGRFDPLGGSLSVLYGVAEPQDYELLVRQFLSVDTKHGVTIKCRHNPVTPREAVVIHLTDGVVVWPFVVGFSVMALMKMGELGLALNQFGKLVNLDGFYEWYDPSDGQGYGATHQLWSAALFLRALGAIS